MFRMNRQLLSKELRPNLERIVFIERLSDEKYLAVGKHFGSDVYFLDSKPNKCEAYM